MLKIYVCKNRQLRGVLLIYSTTGIAKRGGVLKIYDKPASPSVYIYIHTRYGGVFEL